MDNFSEQRSQLDDERLHKPDSSLLRSTGQLSGERRNVTVLFADISGFTVLAEQMDAEEVSRLLNLCFDVLAPVIEKYNGIVDKFIGDEVMALFGAPVAHEDDAERALRAALEMMQRVTEFNARYGLDWGLHIGINTGPVIAAEIGSLGQRRYTVIGTAVNLAARLRDLAQRGEIFVGQDTYHQTAALFDFVPLQPVSVKGKIAPVQAFRLAQIKSVPRPVRGILGVQSPLVGRRAELNTLLQASEELRAGHGKLVCLVGDPGVGKSCLMNAWKTQAARGIPALRFAEGRCISYGQQMAYHLLSDLLCSILGINPLDPVEGVSILRAYVARLPLAEQEQVTPYLAHWLGFENEAHEEVHSLDPQILQSRYLTSLRIVVQSLSAHTPLILICEDIHWADPSSVELLLRLLPLVQESAVMFFFISRLDQEVPGARLLAEAARLGQEDVLNLHLTALEERDSRTLVRNLFKEQTLSENLIAWILSKAEGNPFFIEEVIRMLLDQGLVTQTDGEWSFSSQNPDIHIPDSLQGLLLARIDRLMPEVKRTLQVAAVVGRRFDVNVLQKSMPETVNLEDDLGELVEVGLLSHVPEPEKMEYVFQHNLVHEVAYQSLLREDRRRLHCVIGEALEALYPGRREELAAELARHFQLAEENKRALDYHLLAGSANLRRYALSEAALHFEQALGLAQESKSLLSPAIWQKIYLTLARVYELRSQTQQAKALYEDCARLGRAFHHPDLEMAAIIELARLYSLPNLLFDATCAVDFIQKGMELALQLGDRLAESRLEWITMLLNWMQGDSQSAVQHGERSLTLARQLGAKEQIAFALHDLNRSYINLGQLDEGLRVLDESREIWRELNNLPMLADNLCSTADNLIEHGLHSEALRYAKEAYALSLSIENLWNQGFSQAVIGESAFILGLIDTGLQAYQMSLDLCTQSGLQLLRQRVYYGLVSSHLLVGDYETSRKLLNLSMVENDLAYSEDAYSTTRYIIDLIKIRTQLASKQVTEAQESFNVMAGLVAKHLSSRNQVMEYLRVEIALLCGENELALHLAQALYDKLKTMQFRGIGNVTPVGLLGIAYLAAGQPQAARQALRQALEDKITREELHPRWRLLAALAKAEAALGNGAAAAQAQTEAQGIIDFISAHIADSSLCEKFLILTLGA
ncbi:MAG TPA: adenylate/guanylate cyclase domain-containing protein [Anaerolineaceae bacterium]|nr:adenylate/guanylate cyclase domain-containing protein [Anaerolineaceae bacterium]